MAAAAARAIGAATDAKRRYPGEGRVTRALILANGDKPSGGLLSTERRRADLFIATDGAANWLSRVDLPPDVVLGDFDSLDPQVRCWLPEAAFVNAFNQEMSDLDKAIAHAVERGADIVTVLGAGGGRIDHALVAVSVLFEYAGRATVRLVDDAGVTQLVTDTAMLHGKPGDTLSLIPFHRVEGVTAEGVKWPLNDETLTPGSRGVSNEFVRPTARVSVRRGALVLCHLRAAAERTAI